MSTPVPDELLPSCLRLSAPRLSGAAYGIEAIAELLLAAGVGDDVGDEGELQEAMTRNREGHLFGAIAILAGTIAEEVERMVGEDAACWGSAEYLAPHLYRDGRRVEEDPTE